MKYLGSYHNGNYKVYMFDDGTKIRANKLTTLEPDFPESIDMKICNRCDRGCAQCFTAGTKVMMADHTYKNIEDVVVGDRVIGFEEKTNLQGAKRKIEVATVLNTFVHVESELYEIVSSEGNRVTVTPNHPFLADGRGAGHVRKFVPIERIEEGQGLYAYGFPVDSIDYDSLNYAIGYTVGSWVGDGSLSKTVDKNGYDSYHSRFVTLDEEINDKVYFMLSKLSNEFYRLPFKMTGHEETPRNSVVSAKRSSYEFLTELIKSSLGNESSKEYACGYLAGFCDSEGHVDNERGIIRLANTNVDYLKECERCLDILGVGYVFENYNRPKGWNNWKPVYNVRITGKFGASQFLWYTRPVCKRKSFENFMRTNTQYHKDPLASKVLVNKKQYVYNLETTSHTYIANNFMVHNCHECSTPDGDLANLNHPILNSLSPLTELALGGGNVLEHPDLDDFLKRMKDQGVLCNMTVHVDHFISNYDRLLAYSKKKLIHGLGISVNYPVSEAVAASIAKFPNAVVHVIAGIVTSEALEVLYDRDIKLLILGYKDYGRGEGYHAIHPEIETNIEQMKASLQDLADHFSILSFDNLAIKQFDLPSIVPDSVWEMGYMGDDGQFTMYIDLVKEEYAVSSVSPRHPLNEDEIIETVFAKVKKEAVLNGGK